MKRTTLTLAALLAAVLAAAAGGAERVYKWTDDNGVVHFSASPPTDRGAERVTLPAHRPPSAPAAEESPDEPATAEGPVYAQAEPPDNSAVDEANRRKLCNKGRNMLAQLEPRPRVYRIDEDGNQIYLSDEERLELLDEARQLMADNCE